MEIRLWEHIWKIVQGISAASNESEETSILVERTCRRDTRRRFEISMDLAWSKKRYKWNTVRNNMTWHSIMGVTTWEQLDYFASTQQIGSPIMDVERTFADDWCYQGTCEDRKIINGRIMVRSIIEWHSIFGEEELYNRIQQSESTIIHVEHTYGRGTCDSGTCRRLVMSMDLAWSKIN